MKLLILFCFIGSTLSHSYHLGKCPVVEPMQGFEMSKFLGIWYGIQKTSTASSCLVYNISRGDEPGEYVIEQDTQHFALGLTPLKHEYRYTGDLTVPDASVPGKLVVRFPLSVAGSAGFTVFSTDYDTYGGIFSCQSLTFAHRLSATILSRHRDLDRIYVDKLRSKLSSFSVDPFDLSNISQNDCPKEKEGVDINIDQDTFSAASVAGVIRKAGEKIGDGFEYVAGAGKKVYNKLTSAEETDANKPKSGNLMMEKDAEWLP